MKNLSLLLWFLLISICSLYSNNEVDSILKSIVDMRNDSNKVNLMNEVGLKFKDSLYQKALDVLNESQLLARKINFEKGVGIAHFNKGIVYVEKGFDNEALKEFSSSLEIMSKLNIKEYTAKINRNIGRIYEFWGKNHIAINYYLDALRIYESLNDKLKICSTQLSLANAYSDIDVDKALNYYDQTLHSAKLIKDTSLIVFALNNAGNVYMNTNDYDKALKYYQMSLDANKTFNDSQGRSAALSNIGSIHIKLGNYKKALEFLNKSQEIAVEFNYVKFMIENKKYSSIAYEKMGIYKRSLELFKEYVTIKDSIYDVERQNQILELEAQYESNRKDKEIELWEHKDKISKFQLHATLTGLLIFLVFGFLIYRTQKNRIKQDRELMNKNKLIHEAQKKLTDAEIKEKTLLKEELESKKSELINFALHIIHKNELIQDIKSCLRKVKSSDKNEQMRTYNDLILKLNQNLKTSNELQEFQVHVEKVNHEYFFQLQQKFPELTDNEKRLSALLRLNLSSKEIATLNNISVKAVEMGRYRLRKKLDLDQNISLSKFLQNL